ncbi:Cell wall-associated protease precursor [Roseovarius albus]|uniref:Cell wall-associated protease n=1 Tax=Roseovarius albus TaxID=1247867 RepID=A0A1X7A218_9RHOB|nr:S8 family serine peptidase [Roseovarius albus]SLN68442.1 Cell wall-associated protease precursor [Roseovarius albus]
MMKKKCDKNDPSKSDYYYLWHLVSLGVVSLKKNGKDFSHTLWDKLEKKDCLTPSKVLMLDVGCSSDHPNLKGRVDRENSIDFTITPYGSRLHKGDDPGPGDENFKDLDTEGLVLEHLSADDDALFEEVVQHLKASKGYMRSAGDSEKLFSSHGTAITGLAVGGPEITDKEDEPTPGVIPYFGVDPFSKLISIRTGFDDDPLQFAAALLYAWMLKPDVIIMPRGLPDPKASALEPSDDFQAELQSWANREAADLLHRIELMEAHAAGFDPKASQPFDSKKRLWVVVRALFVALSKHVPIVCASGNEGESQMSYPASLATRENGIISVGSVSALGYRSGYSNYGEGLTLVAPSDDMEVFNRHQLRGNDKQLKEFEYLLPEGALEIPYSKQALLATDVPGRFGYDIGGDVEDGEDDDQTGLYTQFGGTSGATALVGGVIALIRRAERRELCECNVRDGCDIKALLVETARRDMPTPDGDINLHTDSMNREGEEALPFESFFGAGLVDAMAAVKKALK